MLEKIQDRVKNCDDGFSRGMKKAYNDRGENIIQDIGMLQEKIDIMIEKADREDEAGLESVRFLRNASIGVSSEELYDMENEFVEKETRERKSKQKSREERKQKRIKKLKENKSDVEEFK